MEKTKKEDVVKLMNRIISDMINASLTTWPGEFHTLVPSKILNIRIVFIDNIWNGFQEYYDNDCAFVEGLPGLSDIFYLYQVNSNFFPYKCAWENDMNHFLYLQEIPTNFIADGDKHHAYTGKGDIDMLCHSFVLEEAWESLVKRIFSSSEDSNQASMLLPTEESTSEESSQEPLIASTTINDISTVLACSWHQADIKKIPCVRLKV